MNRIKGIVGMYGAINHLKNINAKIEELEKQIEGLEHTEENFLLQHELVDQINELNEEYEEWKYYYEKHGMIYDKIKAELM